MPDIQMSKSNRVMNGQDNTCSHIMTCYSRPPSSLPPILLTDGWMLKPPVNFGMHRSVAVTAIHPRVVIRDLVNREKVMFIHRTLLCCVKSVTVGGVWVFGPCQLGKK